MRDQSVRMGLWGAWSYSSGPVGRWALLGGRRRAVIRRCCRVERTCAGRSVGPIRRPVGGIFATVRFGNVLCCKSNQVAHVTLPTNLLCRDQLLRRFGGAPVASSISHVHKSQTKRSFCPLDVVSPCTAVRVAHAVFCDNRTQWMSIACSDG